MSNLSAIRTFFVISILWVQAGAADADNRITVNLGRTLNLPYTTSEGSIRTMVGFLHSIPEGENWTKYVPSLNPSFWRTGKWDPATLALFEALDLPVHYQIVVSDTRGAYDKPADFERWPYNNWDDWEAFCRELALVLPENTGKGGISLDIWNEPDYRFFWSGTKEQFFETWCRAAAVFLEIRPDILLAGPSIAGYSGTGKIIVRDYLIEFLTYIEQWNATNPTNNITVHYLTWHTMAQNLDEAISDIHYFREHAIGAGSDFPSCGINDIAINEYLLPNRPSTIE